MKKFTISTFLAFKISICHLIFIMSFSIPLANQSDSTKSADTSLVLNNTPGTSIADSSATLNEVTVTAHRIAQPKSGSIESGYRVDSVSAGPLGTAKLQDLPLSISVASKDFLKNIQAGNATDALKYNPVVNPEMGSNRGGDYFSIRGFINSSNQAIDGMRSEMAYGILEDKESIEILNGSGCLLYGIASPAGTINYTLKRPPERNIVDITIGDYGGEQAYAHADIGGRIGVNNDYGYRVNVLGVNDGNTPVKKETNKRYLLSSAFDWRLAPSTILAFDGAKFTQKTDNMQAYFLVGAVTDVPDAPDASVNYSAPYSFMKKSYSTIGSRLTSTVNVFLSIHSAFRYSMNESEYKGIRNSWINNKGIYTQQMMYYLAPYQTNITQGNLFADLHLKTMFIDHKISIGYSQDNIDFYSAGSSTYKFASSIVFSMDSPGFASNPNVSTLNFQFKTQSTKRQTALITDNMDLGKYFSLLGGVAYATIEDRGYSSTDGTLQTKYDKGAITPGIALSYKPIEIMSTYVSYLQSLEKGPIAPSTAANANEVLKPYESSQIEAGVKASVGNVDIAAAFFHIEKANSYTDPKSNIFCEDGREIHLGAEISFSGKVTNDLLLSGGYSQLKATIEKTNNATIKDKSPQAVPEAIARLYAEYTLPFLKSVTLTAGISYTGKEWVNDANTLSIPAVFTNDAGLRYENRIFEKSITLRLGVNNLSNEDYWTTKGGGMLYLGSPRSVCASTTIKL
jgi:iron complex outermembrane recepter protein